MKTPTHCIVILTLVVLVFPFALGCSKQSESSATPSASAPSERCPHEIKTETCPFCNPEMIEADGFCGSHGVAEALCVLCRPHLKTAFRAKGDWCPEHKIAESQCITCDPSLKENIRTGGHGMAIPTDLVKSSNCQHGISASQCPFCTPSLIESDGFCGGHDVAEALCVKCRPFLKVAFEAAGDWCPDHNTPESQCSTCNPTTDGP